jgi:fructose-specific component phosphotransferase system IIB-like protein
MLSPFASHWERVNGLPDASLTGASCAGAGWVLVVGVAVVDEVLAAAEVVVVDVLDDPPHPDAIMAVAVSMSTARYACNTASFPLVGFMELLGSG